jgi:hypothetical protein
MSSAAMVSKLPTVTGQAIRADKTNKNPTLAPKKWEAVDSHKKALGDEIEKKRGFEEPDIALIMNRLETQMQTAATASRKMEEQRELISKIFEESSDEPERPNVTRAAAM